MMKKNPYLNSDNVLDDLDNWLTRCLYNPIGDALGDYISNRKNGVTEFSDFSNLSERIGDLGQKHKKLKNSITRLCQCLEELRTKELKNND